MKKFFSLICAIAIVFSATAAPAALTEKVLSTQKIEVKKAPRMEKVAQKVTMAARAPKAAALASGTFYTVGGNFYVYNSGWIDYTSKMSSIELTVDGANVSITGLAYWFKEGAITGTLEGNTLTFPSGQLVGTDEYGDEFIVGSNDGETVAENIIFTYDPEAQTLTANTPYIFENSKTDAISCYCYWDNAVFGAEEPEAPELVVLPEGAEVLEYTMDFSTSSGDPDAKSINVAVVGDQVYFQGMSAYIPESWVVGTKSGNTISFAANQYMGEYYGYTSYFFYSAAEFTYDAENDKYSAAGLVFGVLGNQYYDGYYTNPVLSRAIEPDFDHPIEVAITEATHKFDASYKDVIYTLSNATADTVFQFDIYPAEGLEDVEDGVVYTLEDMEPNSKYTFIAINDIATSLKSVSFVKTLVGGISNFEATVVDMKSNVFHFACAIEETVPTPIVVPEGLETATYKFAGHDTYYDEDVVKYVQVGFDADTVYILGMSDYVEDAWIKGVKSEAGIYEFPACFLGSFASMFGSYDLYSTDLTMAYDAELDQFTCEEFITIADEINWDEYADIILSKFTEVAATPADPEITEFAFADTSYPKVKFNIPLVGTEGEDLNPEKLSYIFFIQRENEVSPLVLTTDIYEKIEADMTEIPYNFSDSWDIYNYALYLNQSETEVRGWDKLGLQSIYRGADEEHTSNIVWYDVKAYWAAIDGDEQGIENADAAKVATKRVVNGQLIIEKNGVRYNAIGTIVK